MISICIPVYNFEVVAFIKQIHTQFLETGKTFEIIVADDGSNKKYLSQYDKIRELSAIRLILAESNLGRSKIRNMLVEKAQFENILFCDCDSGIVNESFAETYLKAIENNYNCVFGGRVYPIDAPDGKELHWKVGSIRESLAAEERAKDPYRFFMTNNFLIKKKLFQDVSFDESLCGYGYEDSFFSLMLKSKGYSINHINNPLVHLQLEKNEVFLKKTREALDNLFSLSQKIENGAENIKVLRVYRTLKKFKLIRLVCFLYKKNYSFLVNHLSENSPNLYLFDFYKLGYFSIQYDEKMKKDAVMK